ncbi:hypothetical protein CGL52_14325 [Pyrobaculum aerophilum]|uniref:Uncharacterized protein n=2 Tax=Pyrobaculum aerophilum TaxID=13773 RepID=A0A371QW60_9CREN|nr:hypothetical protein CGL52_14325 [Pyrobaculum aerophilum]
MGIACKPSEAALSVMPYLRPLLDEMANYWCLCVKYADRCERGECPVDLAKCAAAYVAVLNERGSVVRGNYYVHARGELPDKFYEGLAKAASRMVRGARYLPYEILLALAVHYFLGGNII